MRVVEILAWAHVRHGRRSRSPEPGNTGIPTHQPVEPVDPHPGSAPSRAGRCGLFLTGRNWAPPPSMNGSSGRCREVTVLPESSNVACYLRCPKGTGCRSIRHRAAMVARCSVCRSDVFAQSYHWSFMQVEYA